MGGLAASRDRVDVWWCTPSELSAPKAVAVCTALLTPDEEADRQRLKFAENRHEFLTTRALCRTALSRYADVAPADWRFERSDHGKPEVASPAVDPTLAFSLTNTSALVACAVTTGQEVGVDAEDTTRSVELLELADRFFSPVESAALRALAPERRRARFFDYWTLKESYVKGRGQGLSIPLEAFSFHVDESAEIRMACDATFDDESAWQFQLFSPLDHVRLAVGVRRERRRDTEIRVEHFSPLTALCAGHGERPS